MREASAPDLAACTNSSTFASAAASGSGALTQHKTIVRTNSDRNESVMNGLEADSYYEWCRTIRQLWLRQLRFGHAVHQALQKILGFYVVLRRNRIDHFAQAVGHAFNSASGLVVVCQAKLAILRLFHQELFDGRPLLLECIGLQKLRPEHATADRIELGRIDWLGRGLRGHADELLLA